MSRTARSTLAGLLYHVVNRGSRRAPLVAHKVLHEQFLV